MARNPAPPGPPPTHYRPPGTVQSTSLAAATRPLGTPRTQPSPTGPGRTSGATVAAVAVGMLIVGLVFGFFIGRAVDDDEPRDQAAATTTEPTTSQPAGGTIPPEPPTSEPDPNAPPSTDIEPTVIGTLDDPIPFGQPYILGVFEITVTATDFDAAGRLADHDASNPEPPPGDRRILVELLVRFADSTGFADSRNLPAFQVSDGSEVWSEFEAACGRIPDSLLDGFFLGPGEDTSGNVCFTVPTHVIEAPAPLYLTTEGFDREPIYFSLE